MHTFTFTTADGLSLWACAWEAEQPKAALCLIHGLGEHAGRYEQMALALNRQGISVYAYDQRGHGHSPGKRGVARLEQLSRDAHDFTDRICEETGLPTLLYGHSLGGGVGLYTLLFHTPKVVGGIISSPWLRLVNAPPAALLSVIRALPGLFGNMSAQNGLSAELLCHSDGVGQTYVKDPLNHEKAGLSLVADMSKAGERIIGEAALLPVPLLLLHGSGDGICDVSGSRAFAAAAGDKCRFVEFRDMFHELHNEPAVREQIFSMEAEFISNLI